MSFTYDSSSAEYDDGYDDDYYTVDGCDVETGITELDSVEVDAN